MSTPAGDHAFLHDLERDVSTELTLAESGPPEEQAAAIPIEEWLSDPADDERYEFTLRSLLGAVQALEGSSEAPEAGQTAPPAPDGRHRRTETEGR
jgi:hypothetical protein